MRKKYKYINYMCIVFLITIISQYYSFSQTIITKCQPDYWTLYYFAFGVKYQVSSESLVMQANQFIDFLPNTTNGYVTIRFLVNCKGEKGWHQVLQTDADYNEIKIDKPLTDKVLEFTKSMDIWKKAVKNDKERDYAAFISYKFTDGKITEIIP
jgi:hypothetical protein